MSKRKHLSNALVAALPVVLTACGGGSENSGVANADSKSVTTKPTVNAKEQSVADAVSTISKSSQATAKTDVTLEKLPSSGTNTGKITASTPTTTVEKSGTTVSILPKRETSQASSGETTTVVNNKPVTSTGNSATDKTATAANTEKTLNNTPAGLVSIPDLGEQGAEIGDETEIQIDPPAASKPNRPTVVRFNDEYASPEVNTLYRDPTASSANNGTLYYEKSHLEAPDVQSNIQKHLKANVGKVDAPAVFFGANYGLGTIKSQLKTSQNKNLFLFMNFYPVFAGMPGIKANAAVDGYAPTTLSYDGAKVQVGLIDGAFKGSTYLQNNPVEVSYKNKPTREEDILEATIKANHGTTVGLIIAGKQGADYQGIAPGVTLHYLQMPKQNLNFGDMYHAMYQQKVSVVNNSYSFSNVELIGPVSFNDTYNVLAEIAKNKDAPLFVYSTGNQPTKTQNGKVVLNTQQHQTGPSHQLVTYTTDYLLQDIMLTVTGLNIKVPEATEAQYKADLAKWESLSAAQKKTVARPVIQADKSFLTLANVAIPCGETKWSCIAALNNYYVPDLENPSSNKLVAKSGTSYAAPQVTATAAILKQAFPWMTSANLKTTLLTTAIDLGEVGVDSTYGWGALNAARALQGPMQFAFGDFYADLTGHAGNYYFVNNINGEGGLVVNSNSKNSTIVLTGNNTYKGDTRVQGATLVVRNSLASRLRVLDRGLADISTASINNDVVNNGKLIATGATVKGNFTQYSGATLVLEPKKVFTIRGKAHLNGAVRINNADHYVTSTHKLQKVLHANDLVKGTYFTDKVLEQNSLVNYDLYYDYTQGNVFADIYRVSATAAGANLADSDLENGRDYDLVLDGSEVIENFLQKVDNAAYTDSMKRKADLERQAELSKLLGTYEDQDDIPMVTLSSAEVELATDNTEALTTSPSAAEELAKGLQNLSDTELKNVMKRAAGTALPNAILASQFIANQATDQFYRSSVNPFSQLNSNINAYFDVEHNSQDWKQLGSSVKGTASANQTTAGIFGEISGYRYGGAISLGKNEWQQGVSDTTDATVKTNSYSFSLHAAKEIATDVAFGGGVEYNNFQLSSSRSVVEADQKINAKLSVNEYRFLANLAKRFRLSNNFSLQGAVGLGFAHSQLNATSETAEKDSYKDFAFSFKDQSFNKTFVRLELQADYSFDIGDYRSRLFAGLNYERTLNNPKLSLTTTSNINVNSTLNNRNIISLIAGYGVNLTNNLTVNLSAKYSKSDTWSNTNVNLGVNYAF